MKPKLEADKNNRPTGFAVTKDKPGKFNDPTGVVISDLKALLFWATIGVIKSRGGYQDDEIVKIIESYADHFKFQLPRKPRFMRLHPVVRGHGQMQTNL